MMDVLRPVRRADTPNELPLDRVLTGVPASIATAIREWVRRSGRVEIHVPEPGFREFRFAVDTVLPEFVAAMDVLRRDEHEALLCGFDSSGDHGLDEAEARALLDMWVRVEFIHRIPTPDGFRLLAGGTFREDHVGLAFTLDAEAFGSHQAEAVATLDALEGAGITPAVLFTNARAASHLGDDASPLAQRVARLAALGTAPGAILAVNRMFGVLTTSTQASSVRRYWKSPGRMVTRYDSPPASLRDVLAMQTGIRDAGARFDASLPPGETVDEQHVARWGAYLQAGAYTPQRFDVRSPAAGWKNDAIVELVPVPYGNGLWRTWEAVRLSPLRRLERLLDYFRIESYLRRITDIGFAQRYHEFRVYNWGTGDPNPRTLLLDCGPLGAFGDAAGLICDAKRLSAHLGRRWHARPEDFFEAAIAEAKARTVSRSTDALQLQHDEHEYLETIDAAAPLRADVAHFAAAMPATLGATLELGAGFGQLASRLRQRATSYVALDLEPKMLTSAAQAANARGVIGDFHNLPFRDALFDSVIANNVLEHAYDPLAALREVHRTLKPGGALHALIPLDGLNPAYRLPAHLWKADLPGIRWAAEAVGLDVEAADAVDLYGMHILAAFPSCNGLVCRLRARRPWSF